MENNNRRENALRQSLLFQALVFLLVLCSAGYIRYRTHVWQTQSVAVCTGARVVSEENLTLSDLAEKLYTCVEKPQNDMR